MILIPSALKKYSVAVLALVAVVAAVIVFGKKPPARLQMAALPLPSSPTIPMIAITMDDYKAAAAAAVKGFAPDDATAVSSAINRLVDVKVPAEGKTLHFELVKDMYVYSHALSLSDAKAKNSTLARLKEFSAKNAWLGLNVGN